MNKSELQLSLVGRRAIVTGASAGIGREIAAEMSMVGADVFAVARRQHLLDELVAESQTAGGGVMRAFACDVTSEQERLGLIEAATATMGGVDILINCAGGSRTVALGADESEWREAMELNFWSLHRLTHALVPGMMERRWGRIVNITGNSEPQLLPLSKDPELKSNLNATTPAKVAVHVWSKGLSREVGPFGVTVNCVPPGVIRSEQNVRWLPHLTPETLDNAVGRIGEPSDLAPLVVFLCTDLAGYITGEIISVDGGKRRWPF